MPEESAHPDRIGAYAVQSRLGAGGMGTVYLGRHEETGELAAVKVLPASLAREGGFVARFEREVGAMSQLRNPHVVEFRESGIDDGRHYYVMEYVDGETITARLHRTRRIPWREVIDIAIQICLALKAAHDAGIVHRDLKPSNLMLDRHGTVKLTDFGIAHVFASTQLTATGGVIGTAEFMSPEQAKGGRVTKQSDLYSLGAVMYVMLTGRPPFSGKSANEVIQKHIGSLFDRPRTYVPDLPHWLDDLVCELLEKDPDDRPPDAFVLKRRLESILAKVELSSSESETRTSVATGDLTTSTVVQDDGPRGPGAATLMRDLVKAEVERSQQKSAVGRVLDNTWVLVGLLAAVVGFGIWMGSSPGSADDDAGEPDTALRRFLQKAQRERTNGNPAAAERTLTALRRLIEETGQYRDSLDKVDVRLESVRRQLEADQPDELLRSSLEQARGYIDAKVPAAARAVLDDLEALYADDPRAAERITRLRRQLDANDPQDER